MDYLDLFQFGMTSQRSTENLGTELLTWYRAGFRALTSALQGRCGDATGSQERRADCGLSIKPVTTVISSPTVYLSSNCLQSVALQDAYNLYFHP